MPGQGDGLDSICLTYRHDYGLMEPAEREEMRERFRGIYEHHVRPLERQLAECKEKLKETMGNYSQSMKTANKTIEELIASHATAIARAEAAEAAFAKEREQTMGLRAAIKEALDEVKYEHEGKDYCSSCHRPMGAGNHKGNCGVGIMESALAALEAEKEGVR